MALAAGMKGENAVALRTTVLVTVVLTVVVFGGTIGRMIEILGIRTGVEEDEGESSDEEGLYTLAADDDESCRPSKKGKRRSSNPTTGITKGITKGGNSSNHGDNSPPSTADSNSDPHRFRTRSRTQSTTSFADGSPSSESDSDTDVLPTVTASEGVSEKAGDLTRVWRDGQWFTVLDERYLLPVFSNATASRRQASKKALRSHQNRASIGGGGGGGASGSGGGMKGGIDHDDISPPTSGRRPEFNGSFTDILTSLVGPATSSSTVSTYKRRDSIDEFSGSTIDLNAVGLTRQPSSSSGRTTPVPSSNGNGQGGAGAGRYSPNVPNKRGGTTSGSDGSNGSSQR